MSRNPLQRSRRSVGLLAALGVAGFVISPVQAQQAMDYRDEQPGYGAMVVDGVFVRPLGLAATVVGAAFWVVTLPFSALGGNVGEAADSLVVEPAQFTFTRPLGDL